MKTKTELLALLDRATAERDALQVLLTAADERADAARAFVSRLIESAGGQPSIATGYLSDILDALKPAECNNSCEFCKGRGFRANPDGADEGCGACNGAGKEPSDDQQ